MIVDKKKFQLIKLDKLVKADWNYKLDDEKKRLKLLNQIKRNGQLENIIVRELETGFYEVVNGNHRMDVFNAIEEVTEVMVFNLGKISLSDAKRIAVETNETRFESSEDQLNDLLIELTNDYELPDLEETMPWTLDELLDMTTPEMDLEDIIGEDDIPEPKEGRVKKGDLWLLGDHRLVCGDATSEEDMGVLMGKERADMVFTDPPYGMDKGFKNDKFNSKSDKYKFHYNWMKISKDMSDVMLCWYDPKRISEIIIIAHEKLKWEMTDYLHMYKPNDVAFPLHSWIRKSESILIFGKGK